LDGWKTHDDNGNPTKAEVEAKIQELKDAEVAREAKKEEAKAKLLELGLTEEHLKALGI
jgi:hypothetical protein